ncbi:hypothetical protein CVT24_005746 [Panaeolus cyanescens]|uniref:Protein kinase domain-containing protein n=1 Tax=Panaeolus cyanescens TaxID=181874 RepID=A0A409V963_9AGAR|nr:hypothetical protein CVT24_005746 [Panaeolus cyanescens]
MLRILEASGDALNLAGSLSGVPLVGAAAILVQEIVKTCEDIKAHKKKARQLSNRCIEILNTINEQSEKLDSSELHQIIDQLIPFNIALSSQQREMNLAMRSDTAEIRELLYQVLTSPADRREVVQLQNAGIPIAERLMEAGQRELQLLRHGPQVDSLLDGEPIPRVSSPEPLPAETSRRYLEYQRGLINLHRETGIPPTVKILNNEVRRIGELAVAGGFWSDIWQGLWLDEQKVALKGLRNIRSSNPKAKQGEAQICDFGTAKLIEDVTEKSASQTLTAGGSARWLAPEVIKGEASSPTITADIYSYAMAVLELLTGKRPYADCKRDVMVIQNIVFEHKLPKRPDEDEVGWPLSDGLWGLMTRCWDREPSRRPSMADVTSRIESLTESGV